MMGALRRAIESRLTSEPRYPSTSAVNHGRTYAGVRVNADTALQQATLWACHRYLTQTVGQLPAQVRRMKARGFSEQIHNHPVDNLLTWRTNPELAPFQFKETMVGWAMMRGNGVAEIERDNRGQVIALWPIHPDRVDIRRDVETGELLYRISNGQQEPVYLKSPDVFHLRGYGHGPVGLGVVEYAAESIGWARATEIFGASFFGEGMHFGGAVTLTGKADPASIERMRAELEAIHRGPSRAGKWWFGDNGAKVEKMTATPDEAQFVATMQHQVEEMCRWCGCPPQKVYHMLRMTFNNVEQISIEVVVDTVTPWAIRFEEECNYKLFGQNRAGFFVKLNLKGLLRGDFQTRQTGLQIMRRNGIINANQWAEYEDMPEIPADDGGDTYIVEGNMTTLENVGQAQPGAGQVPGGDPVPAGDTSQATSPDSLATTASMAGLAILADLESELIGV